MRVFKCDRCGNIYNPEDETYPRMELKTQFEPYGEVIVHDLCPKCQAFLRNWYHNVQSKEN